MLARSLATLSKLERGTGEIVFIIKMLVENSTIGGRNMLRPYKQITLV